MSTKNLINCSVIVKPAVVDKNALSKNVLQAWSKKTPKISFKK